MYRVLILPYFKKQLKPLAKKHRGLAESVVRALDGFDIRQARALGSNIYKLRVRIVGSQKGKSGSFRLLVLVVFTDNILAPLTVYAKNEKATLSKDEVEKHLSCILEELLTQSIIP